MATEKKNLKNPAKKKKWWQIRKNWAIILVSLDFLVLLTFSFWFSPWLGLMSAIVLLPISSGLLGFTIVKEGTAKVVLKFGEFNKVLIEWKGKKVKKNNWDVVKGEEPHLFGGLRWFGFWPIYDIYEYKFSWTGVRADGTFDPKGPEILDCVLLKDDVYGLRVEGAEDRNKVPLDFDITLTVQIINPYKALFTVQNWFETLINRLSPYVRNYITNHTYDWMIEDEVRIDKEIVEDLVKEGIIGTSDKEILRNLRKKRIKTKETEESGEFFDRYGILVRRLEVRNFDPQQDYREATLRKYQAERDAEARAHKTIGALIQMIAQSTGKEPEQVQEEIGTNPELKKRFMRLNSDLITRQMAIEGNAFFDLRYQGPDGIGSVLSAIAAWQRMAQGAGAGVPQPVAQVAAPAASATGQGQPSRGGTMSLEEANAFLDDLYGDEEEEEEEEEEEKQE